MDHIFLLQRSCSVNYMYIVHCTYKIIVLQVVSIRTFFLRGEEMGTKGLEYPPPLKLALAWGWELSLLCVCMRACVHVCMHAKEGEKRQFGFLVHTRLTPSPLFELVLATCTSLVDVSFLKSSSTAALMPPHKTLTQY